MTTVIVFPLANFVSNSSQNVLLIYSVFQNENAYQVAQRTEKTSQQREITGYKQQTDMFCITKLKQQLRALVQNVWSRWRTIASPEVWSRRITMHTKQSIPGVWSLRDTSLAKHRINVDPTPLRRIYVDILNVYLSHHRCPKAPNITLAHISLASILWGIGKQCRTRSDAA